MSDVTKQSKGRRDKSRDMVSSFEFGIIKLEVSVEEMHATQEERIGQIEADVSHDDLRGEMQGALNAAVHDLLQQNEALDVTPQNP
ncbi:putative serine/threonine-protein kinase [Dorcoceras hygrometricum]|uniref:Putative serine/threonine-protein kinase n=1 Tax=Dorcoceras hygrometricum TaxID=472368 RepID=A0A2Z7C9R3_9LAMI|nr:putative serine/threonine-protein kinase [Dorcoceras hygrometricum]